MGYSAHAATITFTAGLTTNGFDEVGGDDLDAGNLVRMGYFDITDSDIVAHTFDLGYLNSHFTEFDNQLIGLGVGNTDGHIAASYQNSNSSTVNGLVGKQIYIWTYFSSNTSTEALALSTVQQHAILYVAKGSNSNWAFPDESTGGRNPSLRDITVGGAGNAFDSTNGHLLVGTFGPGTSSATGKPNITLIAVPEPSVACLAGIGLLGLMRRRR